MLPTPKPPHVSMVQASPTDADPRGGKDPVEDAMVKVVAMMHGIDASPAPLGPVLTSKVELDGFSTDALMDTGSPASIIALDFFLKSAAAQRPPGQSPTSWAAEVRQCIQPSSMGL